MSIRNRVRGSDDRSAAGGSVAEMQLCKAKRRKRGAYNGCTCHDPGG